MNPKLPNQVLPMQGKPHTWGWLIGAIIFSILPIAPAAFVYSEWQNINEFTLMVTMIPAVLVFLLCFAAFALWLVWTIQAIRAHQYNKYWSIHEQITQDIQREQSERGAPTMPRPHDHL